MSYRRRRACDGGVLWNEWNQRAASGGGAAEAVCGVARLHRVCRVESGAVVPHSAALRLDAPHASLLLLHDSSCSTDPHAADRQHSNTTQGLNAPSVWSTADLRRAVGKRPTLPAPTAQQGVATTCAELPAGIHTHARSSHILPAERHDEGRLVGITRNDRSTQVDSPHPAA